MAQSRHAASAGIQVVNPTGRARQRVVAPVVVSDAPAEFAVRSRATELLNPRVLVRRDGLLRQLAADPVRLLGHHHRVPVAREREGGSASARAAADDDRVGGQLAWPPVALCPGWRVHRGLRLRFGYGPSLRRLSRSPRVCPARVPSPVHVEFASRAACTRHMSPAHPTLRPLQKIAHCSIKTGRRAVAGPTHGWRKRWTHE